MAEIDFILMVGSNAYQSERAYTALSFAIMAATKRMKVKLVLFENGVFLARKGQMPEAYRSAEEWLMTFMDLGGKVDICRNSCKERGVQADELLDGVEFTSMGDLVLESRDAGQTIVF